MAFTNYISTTTSLSREACALCPQGVGRWICNACGFRLARDAAEGREDAQERWEEANGYDDDSEEDEDGNDGSEYGF
ncbi:hypothetical protein EDB19DRAFT_1906647 [Suillus lakei]|nr:hypothetical protein EDB19DRAFT_1906647 [Suillus lakei]